MNKSIRIAVAAGVLASLSFVAGSAVAHDEGEAGLPARLEGNYMMADAMNAPFGVQRADRVIEMDIFTGTVGIVIALGAYALSENHELVAGDWAFQLWYQDELLIEQRFTTYWAEEAEDPIPR